MANWEQLKEFIASNYKAVEISPRALELSFQTAPEHLQKTYVTSAEDPQDRSWVQIDSPIGKVGTLDMHAALALIESAVCGGLCRLQLADGNAYVTVRHCAPIATMDASEFDAPVKLVTGAAAHLAMQLAQSPSAGNVYNAR